MSDGARREDGPGEPPFTAGDRVRVLASGATGVVVEVLRRHGTVDVDLGDGITAEFTYDELAPVGRGEA